MPFGVDDALMLASLIPNVASLFSKKPNKPKYPGYEEVSPGVRQKYLSGIETDIAGQTQNSIDRLTSNLGSRGLARGGLLPKLASDVSKAGTEQFTRAVTEFDLGEARRKNAWEMGKYQTEAGEYGEENQQYYGLLGGAGANIGNILADPKFAEMLERLFASKKKITREPEGNDFVPGDTTFA